VALSLGTKTDPEQLVFTSGGTEANQLAIRSILEPRLARGERPHWITTPVEHDSVLQLVEWLEKRGGTVSRLPVDGDGAPAASALEALVRPETALVSSVWVNNETGVVTDVAALAAACAKAGQGRIALHLDAAQAWGKIPLDVERSGAQLVTFSAHKIGGLAGTGIVWLRRGTAIDAVLPGKQEKGRRGGTENVVGAVAAGAAAAAIDPAAWSARLGPLRDQLERAICERIPGCIVNGGSAARRVANTLNLSFEGVEGDGLVMALDLAGYSVSAGSACASGVLEPSHVLLAMGRTRQQAMAAIRVSLHEGNTEAELEGFVAALAGVVGRMRGGSVGLSAADA
jgi:cysteine desulfurase